MRTLSAVVTALLFASLARADDGEKIGLVNVPKIVMQIAKETAAKVMWLDAFKLKVDEGEFKECYRLVGKDAQGHSVSLRALPDGSIVYVRTEIALAEVPAVVAMALKSGKPGFTPKRSQAVGPADKVIYYRFEGELPTGEQIVMAVRADGKRVLEEEKEM